MAKAQKRKAKELPSEPVSEPIAVEKPFVKAETPYVSTSFEKVCSEVILRDNNFRYGNDTLRYFDEQQVKSRSAEDLAKHIWNAIGGDRLGDGFVAQYLFKLATQQIDKVMKGIVEYARVHLGEEAATVTDVTLEALSQLPFDEFKVEFEEIILKQAMTKWQRFVLRIIKIFK